MEAKTMEVGGLRMRWEEVGQALPVVLVHGTPTSPALWRYDAANGGARAFVRQVCSLDVRDTLAVCDRLPRRNVPARVVWGEADQFQKVRYGGRLARDPGTTLRRIPRGNHFTPEDHPEVTADARNDLVSEVRTRQEP